MSKVHVGMGGWDLQPFDKYFYPPKPKKDFRKLDYYCQFFDSVEINATFYNTSLTRAHAQKWLQDVSGNKKFIFTVKLYQGFTHSFTATKEDVLSTHHMLEPLAEADKLGGIVIQFPYSFSYHPEHCQYLMKLSKALQPHRLFLEVRHNSWNSQLMFNFFQENKLHVVNVDLPRIKQHMPLTCLSWDNVAYFRMMGRNALAWQQPWRVEDNKRYAVSDRYHYLYNDKELEHLLRLIERLNAQTTFVVFHNDPEANSLYNGFQLRHLTKKNQRVLIPNSFVQVHPMLKGISAQVNVHHSLFEEV